MGPKKSKSPKKAKAKPKKKAAPEPEPEPEPEQSGGYELFYTLRDTTKNWDDKRYLVITEPFVEQLDRLHPDTILYVNLCRP